MNRTIIRFLALILAVSLLAGCSFAAGESGSAADEIAAAGRYNLIPACLQNADLSGEITLAEYAALAVRVFEEVWQTQEIPASTPYPGVKGHALQREMEIAYGLGLINCFREDHFSPDWSLGRQMLAMLWGYLYKACEYDDWTYENDASFPLEYEAYPLYEDLADVDPLAEDSVCFLTENNLMPGISADTFDPEGAATREQAIVTAWRIFRLEGEVYEEDSWDVGLPADILPPESGDGLDLPDF